MNEVLIASVRVPTGAQAYTYAFNNSNEFTLKYSMGNTTRFSLLKSRYVTS